MENKVYPKCIVPPAEVTRLKGLGFLRDKNTEDKFNCRVITVNGRVESDFLRKIAEASERFGNGKVTFTTRLTVEVQGIAYENIPKFLDFLHENGLQSGGTGAKVRPVVSCKGSTCQYGLIDTFSLSEKIHKNFYEGYHDVKLPHKFKITVGGCPNNCAKPDINDLGIVGQRLPESAGGCKGCSLCVKVCPVKALALEGGNITVDESKCIGCGRCIASCKSNGLRAKISGCKLYIGGRWGKKAKRGMSLSKIFTDEEEVLEAIENTILFFKANGFAGERFADTVERIDFEKVQGEILSGEPLKAKAEILRNE